MRASTRFFMMLPASSCSSEVSLDSESCEEMLFLTGILDYISAFSLLTGVDSVTRLLVDSSITAC